MTFEIKTKPEGTPYQTLKKWLDLDFELYLSDLLGDMLFDQGFTPSASRFIDEETVTLGYGYVDSLGLFQWGLSEPYRRAVLEKIVT
jgi:hypothetical protein